MFLFSYFYDLKHLPDVTNHLLVNKSLQGYRYTKKTGRFQIAHHCLHIWFTGQMLTSHMYKSLYPVTVTGNVSSHLSLLLSPRRGNSQYSHPLLFKRDVTFQYMVSCALGGFVLTIRGFKHSKDSQKTLHVAAKTIACVPFKLFGHIYNYSQHRKDNSSISRSHFTKHLRMAFIYLGYNPDQYIGHSFRF